MSASPRVRGAASNEFWRRPRKIVSQEKDKPVLDEQTFGRLLEAAYVLQEHNRALQKLERNLELHTDQLDAQQSAAQNTALKQQLTILPSPEADASIPEARIPEPRTPETPAAEPPTSAPPIAAKSPAEHVPFDVEPQPRFPVAPAATAAAQPAASPAPKADYTLTLAQIVETQHQIQVRHLELENAMSLVAQRVVEIAKAGGAAIGFVDGAKVRYRGVSGSMTLPAGTEVPLEKALCVATLKTGQVIRSADVNPEFLFDPEECRRRGIKALIAVPIFHEGGIAGGLELYYATAQAFTEQDVHTCQLMAGLITEALAREEEIGWKKSLASERAVMLDALEKLKPKLAALIETPAVKSSASRGIAGRDMPGRDTAARDIGSRDLPARSTTAAVSPASTYLCRKCGHQLVGEEQFCGKCGARRIHPYQPPSMQNSIAPLWHSQEAMKKGPGAPGNGDLSLESIAGTNAARPEKPLADSIEEEMPELFAAPALRIGKMSDPEEFHAAESLPSLAHTQKPEITIPMRAALEEPVRDYANDDKEPVPELSLVKSEVLVEAKSEVKPEPAPNWSSAMTARQFLEQLAGDDRPGAVARFWKARRGDIYLGIAIVLVIAVVRWGIWSSHSVSATGKPTPAAAAPRKAPAEPEVSLFDRMMISLGLAEAPVAPEYRGNPDTQVWVDLHTALYYCPGADLYGKTQKGKFASQRDAQLDQFEPAYRKACD